MTHWDRLSADDRVFVEVEDPLNKMHIAGCFVVDVGSLATLRLRATSEWSRVTACEKQSSPLAADSGMPVASEEQRRSPARPRAKVANHA